MLTVEYHEAINIEIHVFVDMKRNMFMIQKLVIKEKFTMIQFFYKNIFKYMHTYMYVYVCVYTQTHTHTYIKGFEDRIQGSNFHL